MTPPKTSGRPPGRGGPRRPGGSSSGGGRKGRPPSKPRTKPWAKRGGKKRPGPSARAGKPVRAVRAPGPAASRLQAPPSGPPAAAAAVRFPADAEQLVAAVRDRKLDGLREDETGPASPAEHAARVALAQALEESGQVLILSFAPLHLVSKEALDHLQSRILARVEKFHEAHPNDKGIADDKIKDRFGVAERLRVLALKTLVHDGRLREEDGRFARPEFKRLLPPRDEAQLEKIESVFSSASPAASLREIRESVPLLDPKLEALLGVLVERGRLAAGQGGFYFQRDWLDRTIGRLRARAGRELSIAEFKSLTGLSRKYAIPLLELLDDMGVTRRDETGRRIV